LFYDFIVLYNDSSYLYDVNDDIVVDIILYELLNYNDLELWSDYIDIFYYIDYGTIYLSKCSNV
jgi:hypothetical protein